MKYGKHVVATGALILAALSPHGEARAGLVLPYISGLTQCLHVDSTGNVTGTGADCGAGGGGVTTTGASLLAGDGAGGVTNVTMGAGVSYSGGVLSATGGGGGVLPNGLNGNILTSNGSSNFGTPIAAGSGIVTFLTTPTSANLGNALTTKSGTGLAVFNNSPALVTPDLGTPTAINLANGTGLPLTGTTGTLPFNRLAVTGVPTGAKFVRDDGALAVPAGSGAASVGANGAIQTSDGAGGFVALVPGTGISTWLATPSGANLASALTTALPLTKGGTGQTAAGGTTIDVLSGWVFTGIVKRTGSGNYAAAAAGTDFAAPTSGSANTPLFNNGSGGFTNGTRSGNTTTVVTKDASTPATNDCAKWDASGNLTTAGAACGSGGGGGSLTTTDGTNSVLNTTSMTFDSKVFVVGGSGGASTVSETSTVGADKSTVDYTVAASDNNTIIPVGAAHTYTLPQAGSVGFANGWGACFQNVSATGNATITTTTSLFQGAGGGTSFTLPAQAWACPSSKSGNWVTQTAGSGITTAFAPAGWVAGVDPNKMVVMTATTPITVTAIRGTVADAVGAAATVQVNKAPSGTVCASGTNQATGTFNANGTAATNQTLTLVGGSANALATGDRLCFVTTGGASWTGGVGNGGITVAYTAP